MYKYIVTHPGKAHRDELLAVSIAIHIYDVDSVYRREPTLEELQDPEVLVLDVGGRHEPELANFDHHQMDRNAEPACALSLMLEAEGLAEAFSFLPWYAPTVLMDSKGPFATAKELGLGRFPFELLSPVEDVMLGGFSEVIELTDENPAALAALGFLGQIGERLVVSAGKAREAYQKLSETVSVTDIEGVKALVFETTDTRMAQDIRDREHPDAGISLAWDDRGDGWALYRFNDHPRVDFSALEGDSAVLFAHKGGFIAKTRKRLSLDEAKSLVARAVHA
jgi:hypothetical protein